MLRLGAYVFTWHQFLEHLSATGIGVVSRDLLVRSLPWERLWWGPGRCTGCQGAVAPGQPRPAPPPPTPGSGALVLQKGEIRVINQTTCESLLPQQITPRMMCVGYLSGGVDACQVRAGRGRGSA